MTDVPQPIQESWHKPDDEDSKRLRLHGSWEVGENALTEEQLAALRESPAANTPGAGNRPAASPDRSLV